MFILNFTTKRIGGKIKALVFSFVLLMMRKVQKVESINILSDCKTMSKEKTNSSIVFTCNEKVQNGGDC